MQWVPARCTPTLQSVGVVWALKILAILTCRSIMESNVVDALYNSIDVYVRPITTSWLLQAYK